MTSIFKDRVSNFRQRCKARIHFEEGRKKDGVREDEEREARKYFEFEFNLFFNCKQKSQMVTLDRRWTRWSFEDKGCLET